MKKNKTLIALVILIQGIIYENCVQAQQFSSTVDSIGFISKLLNERSAVNSLYDVLNSFENLVSDWNACMSNNDSVVKCEKEFLKNIYIIEVLLSDYIKLTKQPLPDTILGTNRKMILSIASRRLLTTNEANEVLKQCNVLETLVTDNITNNSKKYFKEQERQFDLIREMILTYLNN